MKIACEECDKTYDIPNERLPLGEQIGFPCPACKAIIELDLRSSSALSGGPSPQKETGKQQGAKNHLSGRALRERILRTVSDLPPMPQTVLKAHEIMGDSNSSFEELATVLETDQAIAAKVLKLANSPYYGVSGKVSSVQHASVVLGQKAVGELMTIAGTAGLLGGTLEGYGLDAGHLWQHSMAVAIGSKILATKKNPALVNDALMAGLIHDAGKLVLDKYIAERKEAFEQLMADGAQTFLIAEKEILGFDHSEIACDLCENWRVPQMLTTAIKYHHYPVRSRGNELAYIVHTADAIAMMTGIGGGIDGLLYNMDDEAVQFLELQQEDIIGIMGEVVEFVGKMVQEVQPN